MANFSSAIKLAELDDFIAPSQECIKPLPQSADRKSGKVKLVSYDSGSNSRGNDFQSTKVEISLNDCLACSGCITTAESVLISQQSVDQVFSTIKATKEQSSNCKVIIASLSLQSITSLAVKYGLSVDDCATRLSSFFKSLGVSYVCDITAARSVSLFETAHDLIDRYHGGKGKLPLLTSACPGWICYAEKTHGSWILDHICTVKSPQQIMGAVVKRVISKRLSIHPSAVFHFTVMPCYDKKLEASRSDFYSDLLKSHDVDCVISTIEVETMLSTSNVNVLNLPGTPLDSLDFETEQHTLVSHMGSGSGGYLDYSFKIASQVLCNRIVESVHLTATKNSDFCEAVLQNSDGETVLRFAVANGFRNIQNVVQRMKRGKCQYDFIEIMACPSGCLNGGGQCRPTEVDTIHSSRTVLQEVEELYFQLPSVDPSSTPFMQQFIDELVDGNDSVRKELFYTQYHHVEKVTGRSLNNMKW